jgi:hypothetical protein
VESIFNSILSFIKPVSPSCLLPTYSSQNGSAERKHRHIIET